MADLPLVPLTLEGSFLLHQFFRFDWKAWRSCAEGERQKIAAEAEAALRRLECKSPAEANPAGANTRANPESNPGANPESSPCPSVQTALFSQLGHKGDLILTHFRPSLEALNQIELDLAQTRLYDFLSLAHSYLSVVELGLYESSRQTYQAASAKGFEPYSPEWKAEIAATLARQSTAAAARLFPAVPEAKYICFYPMDRKRGEKANWYNLPLADRQSMLHEHGLIGRRYGDQVKQIISASIGFDDWEWGVDLFADDSVAFKKLIYEMRFDEASAVYALFGQFFIGVRLPIEKLGGWLSGSL